MTDDMAGEIQRVLTNPDVPHIYCNGFSNLLSNCDTMTILTRNEVPVAVLNMSYSTAKTMALKLGQMIAHLEEVTGQQIMTTDSIDSDVARVTGKDGE